MTTRNSITITGTIEAISFRNSDGWAVFSVADETTGERFSCTGDLPATSDIDDAVEVSGVITNHPRYGRQIKATSIVPVPAKYDTREGMIKVLCCMPGVGPAKAGKFVDQQLSAGEKDPIAVAIDDPGKVGVREDDIDSARAILQEKTILQEQMIFLLGIGLTAGQASKILAVCGEKSQEIISGDPYMLSDMISGFGFLTCDKIAFKAGVKAGNPVRVRACVRYCLTDSQVNGGDIKIEGWRLCKTVIEQLIDSCVTNHVSIIDLPSIDDVRKHIYQLASEGLVVIHDGWVYDANLLEMEKEIECAVKHVIGDER